MRKIIFITPEVILPPLSGGKICTYNRIESFLNKFNVSVVMPSSENTQKDKADVEKLFKKNANVLILNRSSKSLKKSNLLNKFVEGIRWLISGKPRAAQTIFSLSNRDLVTQYIIKNNIEVVILEGPYSSELIDFGTLKHYGIKIVMIAHNVEALFIKDYFEKYGIIGRLETKRTRTYETLILESSDLVVSISPEDKKILTEEYKLNNVIYMPTILRKSSLTWNVSNSNYIAFLGSLNFYPNYHGIKWFLENVFVDFVKTNLDIKLKITGMVDKKIKNEFEKYKNVEFTGYLSQKQMEQLILNCSFSIIPIIKGSGVKIKLLESLSYGVPTITTLHPLAGVLLNGKQPFLVGKNPEEFLMHMNKLTSDQNYRAQLGYKAKAFFDTTYASVENENMWREKVLNL